MTNSSDKDLGMNRPISRRDFVNGVALPVGGALMMPSFSGALAQPAVQSADYYPPTEIGLRGSHDGSWEVGHQMRDQRGWDRSSASDSGEEYDLVIVGGAKGDKEQRYLKTVKSAVESSDMRPRIYMVGQQSDIPMFLGAMDLYVQSSTREGLSNALMEAMACGLPVVATDVGGTGELVSHGSTGFIVPPNDPIALARAMNELASDTESRSQMGEAGRKLVVDHYSSAAFLRRMTALYDTGLANAAAKC